MLELIALHFLVCFSYYVPTEISPDASWLDDVATACGMFFSEKLFNKKQISLVKNDVLLFNALCDISNVV